MGDLDELPGQLIELRELIREGHGVIKDMTALMREFRKLAADGAEQSRAAAQQAADTEISRFSAHIQGEMDRHARELNKAVQAARQQVVKALLVKSIEEMPGGGLKASFTGNLFDDGGTP